MLIRPPIPFLFFFVFLIFIKHEKRITPYGNGAKIDAPKRYMKKRVFVIVLKD
ncbi:MAG: DUF2080 family transposase-associated protein [Methanosarcinales archaeon]|uniref:DUF2080 family transposase-associated protein n=1 Tax=Candidatus Ethanoperedens thermophilum TaxID=2766897 RepID=A0A848DAB6_9EURY|nr:DUF2080 family transposase-associated protein [Candidatus Ethanoperedens thermophilum]